jgi:hypothetical protein
MWSIILGLQGVQTPFPKHKTADDQKIDHGAEYAGRPPIQTYCHGTDAVYEVKRAANHHKVMRNHQVEAVGSGVPEKRSVLRRRLARDGEVEMIVSIINRYVIQPLHYDKQARCTLCKGKHERQR